MALSGLFYYVDQGSELKVDREIGRCCGCNSLTAIESFTNSTKLIQKHDKQTQDLKAEYRSIWRYLIQSFFRKQKIDNANSLAGIAKKLYLNNIRKGTEKCLSCGSMKIIPFGCDYSLEYDVILHTGTKDTGFKHPDCGGQIIEEPNPIRFNVQHEYKFSSLNGVRINN